MDGKAVDEQALLSQVGSLKASCSGVRRLLDTPATMDCKIIVNVGPAEERDCQLPCIKKTKVDESPLPPSSSRPAAIFTTPSGCSVKAKTIKAHSAVLSSKSDYFKAMLMKGQWAESEHKTVQVDVDCDEGKKTYIQIDEHVVASPAILFSLTFLSILCTCDPLYPAFETLELLVELSYGGLYTRRSLGADTFDLDTLIKLIMVANMFEFGQCLQECSEELAHSLTSPSVALAVLGALAHLEGAHESLDKLLNLATPVLGTLEDLLVQGPPCPRPDLAVQEAIKTNAEVRCLAYA